MTDPNVGFSIYISDRERERLEKERRRGEAEGKQKEVSNVPLLVDSSINEALKANQEENEGVEEVVEEKVAEEAQEEEKEEEEAILAALASVPVVSISNVNEDELPWKAKHMQEWLAGRRSVCEACEECRGWESESTKKGGNCASCGCDLIHHLKSCEGDRDAWNEEDDEEEEWEEDEEGDDFDDDHFDDAPSDDDDDQDGQNIREPRPPASSAEGGEDE